MAFASTTWVLRLFNCSTRGVTHPEVIVALGVATGGMCMCVAGIWEFAAGNTFGATVFCLYASFWWSYAAIFIPWFNIQQSVPADQLPNALGIYLSVWVIMAFIFLLACLRSSIALITTVFFLPITFILLMAAEFTGNAHVLTAGGAVGIITSLLGFYTAACGLCTADTTIFVLPSGDLSRKDSSVQSQ